MNPTLDILNAHRSIRKFTDQPVTDEQVEVLIEAGQSAATSSFLQGTTVIRVREATTREALMAVAGNQAYVANAPVFLVFCADLRRSSNCCAMHEQEAVKGLTEQFIIATVDVALFAQNVVTGAESMGMGICYIGALRNDPQRVSDLLKLPDEVYPVFGLCLGYPDQDPERKPRLPVSVVLKDEVYSDEHDADAIAAYDKAMLEYYQTRTDNQKAVTWSEQMSGLLAREARPHMRDFLARRGFTMR